MTRDALLKRLLEMPSSLNDALRTMEMAAEFIEAQAFDMTATPWQPISTVTKYETVLAWWFNGEQHTGSTDGERWFPAWDHQDREWAMPQLWIPLYEPDKSTTDTAVALAVTRQAAKPTFDMTDVIEDAIHTLEAMNLHDTPLYDRLVAALTRHERLDPQEGK